jgi:hypothetical protein
MGEIKVLLLMATGREGREASAISPRIWGERIKILKKKEICQILI